MYVDGDMGPVERAIVDDHLKGCARCRTAVTEYKGLLWDLEHPVPDPAPPELAALSDKLMAAWDSAQAKAARPEPERWQDASRIWTQAVPGVQVALGAAGRVGRSLPRAGLSGLTRLGRRLLKGGGGR
jgi:anti-sigma factor RsiW